MASSPLHVLFRNADCVDFERDPDSDFSKREPVIRMSKHLHPDMVQIYGLVWWKVFELRNKELI